MILHRKMMTTKNSRQSILFILRSSHEVNNHQVSKVTKAKVFCPAFFKKLVRSRGKALVAVRRRRNSKGCGGEAPALQSFQKFFGNLFIKKGCANKVRKTETINFSVNHNGRPVVAPTKQKSLVG